MPAESQAPSRCNTSTVTHPSNGTAMTTVHPSQGTPTPLHGTPTMPHHTHHPTAHPSSHTTLIPRHTHPTAHPSPRHAHLHTTPIPVGPVPMATPGWTPPPYRTGDVSAAAAPQPISYCSVSPTWSAKGSCRGAWPHAGALGPRSRGWAVGPGKGEAEWSGPGRRPAYAARSQARVGWGGERCEAVPGRRRPGRRPVSGAAQCLRGRERPGAQAQGEADAGQGRHRPRGAGRGPRLMRAAEACADWPSAFPSSSAIGGPLARARRAAGQDFRGGAGC